MSGRRLPAGEWQKIRERRQRAEWLHRHNDEVAIANTIVRKEPGTSRDEALRRAAEIVARREW